ncbi:hypothetical protein WG68_07665 [Arsukibacterium ikkense]|uniref:DUF4168 domain-containing protein n=1 Tax=Arsukibacterium ikkense TaxID=336831 RepID=A0A0M2V9Q0_9GAMM|nr:DUF4168 domain-containing protein [Arsukibacterium ikkense]KKO45888.1 hypothetical protein WG68_07665 [Arsukibacterium ikkense]
MRKSYLAVVLAGLTMTGTAQLAQAQANPAAPQAQAQQQAINLNDAILLKFSVAMAGVQSVGAKYEAEFQNAEDAEAAQKIQQAAQQEMVAAVEASGLTTEEYNQIAQQAQQDEALRSRILAMTNTQ